MYFILVDLICMLLVGTLALSGMGMASCTPIYFVAFAGRQWVSILPGVHAPVRMQMVVWRVISHFTEPCMQAAQWVECSVYVCIVSRCIRLKSGVCQDE